MAHILVAEKEPDDAAAIEAALREAHHDVTIAETGAKAWDRLCAEPADLVLLSLEIADFRGKELLRRVRASRALRNVPVIVRSNAPDEIDRVLAFELGADDMVSSDGSLRELALRVRAVLRRASARRRRRIRGPIAVGELEFRPEKRELRLGAERRRLTPVECRLLVTLVEQPERVWRRDELLRRVWDAVDVDARTVDSQVRRLRTKLGEAAELIETVRGVGYRLRLAHTSAQSPRS